MPDEEEGALYFHHARIFEELAGDVAGWELAQDTLWHRDISRRHAQEEGRAGEPEKPLPRWLLKVRTVAEFAGQKPISGVGAWDIRVAKDGRGETVGFSSSGLTTEEIAAIRAELVAREELVPDGPLDEEEAHSYLFDEESRHSVEPEFEPIRDFSDRVWESVYPAALALAFMHNKNVTVADNPPPGEAQPRPPEAPQQPAPDVRDAAYRSPCSACCRRRAGQPGGKTFSAAGPSVRRRGPSGGPPPCAAPRSASSRSSTTLGPWGPSTAEH